MPARHLRWFLSLSKNLFTKVSFSHQIVDCWLHIWDPMSLVYIMDNNSSPFLHSESSFTSRKVTFHLLTITADKGEIIVVLSDSAYFRIRQMQYSCTFYLTLITVHTPSCLFDFLFARKVSQQKKYLIFFQKPELFYTTKYSPQSSCSVKEK